MLHFNYHTAVLLITTSIYVVCIVLFVMDLNDFLLRDTFWLFGFQFFLCFIYAIYYLKFYPEQMFEFNSATVECFDTKLGNI